MSPWYCVAVLVLCCVARDDEQQRAVYEECTVWRRRGGECVGVGCGKTLTSPPTPHPSDHAPLHRPMHHRQLS